MKKIITSAVVAAATLSASQAAVFNGASVGLSAGTLTSQNTIKHTVVGAPNYTTKLNKTGGSFGVHFDYDRSHSNSFYWGLGVDFMFNSGTAKKQDKNFTNYRYKIQNSWFSEFDLRLGYNVCNNAIVYGLVGLRLFESKITANVQNRSPLYKKTKTELAPTLGAGFKVKVASNLSAGLEYRYAFEQNTTFKGLNFKDKVKQSSHAVLAKVSYHF